jgi:ankyrin repeat protein
MHLAAQHGEISFLKLLLEYGADINAVPSLLLRSVTTKKLPSLQPSAASNPTQPPSFEKKEPVNIGTFDCLKPSLNFLIFPDERKNR